MAALTAAVNEHTLMMVAGAPEGVHFSFGSDELDMIAVGAGLRGG